MWNSARSPIRTSSIIAATVSQGAAAPIPSGPAGPVEVTRHPIIAAIHLEHTGTFPPVPALASEPDREGTLT